MKPDQTIVQALLKTHRDHQAAFAGTSGQDPNWSDWYAKRLLNHTDFLLATRRQWTTDDLSKALSDLDTSYNRTERRHHWSHYYALRLTE